MNEMPQKVEFLGVLYNNEPKDMLVERLVARAKAKRPFEFLVTPNAVHVVSLDREPEVLGPPYDSAFMKICDSRILAAIARIIFGTKLEVVPGSDLTVALLAAANREGLSVCVVGNSAEDIEALDSLYPSAQFRHYDAPTGLRNSAAARQKCVDAIIEANCHFVLLAVGMPQQEMIAKQARDAGSAVGIGACIGASIDFLVGKQMRAPLFMQRMGLEWLFRLLSQPSRLWRRYLVESPRVFAVALRHRRAMTS